MKEICMCKQCNCTYFLPCFGVEKIQTGEKWHETAKKKSSFWRSTIFDHLPHFGFGDYS